MVFSENPATNSSMSIVPLPSVSISVKISSTSSSVANLTPVVARATVAIFGLSSSRVSFPSLLRSKAWNEAAPSPKVTERFGRKVPYQY